MIPNPSELIDGYLDDALTGDRHAELSAWIQAKPENDRIFVEAISLDDRLRYTLGTDEFAMYYALPSPKPRSSASTLPREGEGGVLKRLLRPREGEDGVLRRLLCPSGG